MTQLGKMEGFCRYCTKSVSDEKSFQHFLDCDSRVQFFEKMKQKSVNDWFYIRAYSSMYWVDILIPKQSQLHCLDHFLRGLWLECCSHLSCFRIHNVSYERFVDPSWWDEQEELPFEMDVRLDKVLDKTTQFSYEYDYGSTTDLELKVVGEWEYPIRKQSFLCARNHAPLFKCMNCDNQACYICTMCRQHACKACSKLNIKGSCVTHEHAFLPLVNSPRTGVCAYGAPMKFDP